MKKEAKAKSITSTADIDRTLPKHTKINYNITLTEKNNKDVKTDADSREAALSPHTPVK